jgi:methionyl aminopeptidase
LLVGRVVGSARDSRTHSRSIETDYAAVISIETPEELERLKAAGRVVAQAIRAMRAHARPGVTTGELDAIGARVFTQAGARSGPQLDYGFPGVNCISVNDEAVHGIPARRRLRKGDLLKLDVAAELDGFYADACASIPIGDAPRSIQKLATASRVALNRGLATARAGVPINHIGRAVQSAVAAQGYSVCPELMGHGIARRIREQPNIPNYDAPGFDQPLTEGLVITIEPIIAAGRAEVCQTGDGWTIKTRDGSCAAHSEHTIVITAGAPVILTA